MKLDTLFVNGTIVGKDGRYEAAIGTRDGKIRLITDTPDEATCDTLVDLSGKYVLPGLIDGHIHFQDPGFEQRDDFEHATAACAVGGITVGISHPMNDPPVIDVASFNQNLAAYENRSIIDYGLHGGGTSENIDQIADLWCTTGATAIKMFMCFSVKEFPFVHDGSMLAILEKLAENDGVALVHCENEPIIRLMEKRLQQAGRTDPLAYNESRPQIAEIEAITRTIYLLEQTGASALVVHVSSAEGLEIINEAKNRGVKIWAETCPHFLSFVREDMKEHGPFLKFSPVMRGEDNRARMWDLIGRGYIDSIGSDHCPFTRAEKEKGLTDIFKAPNGIPGLEVMLPVLLDGVNDNKLTLERVAEITSFNPAAIYGLYPRKGAIQVGADCDLTVVDMDLKKTYSDTDRKTKCDWSPYFGRTFTGWPVMTVVRGTVVAENGEICVEPGYGSYVPRNK
jgi:allantoinase